MQGVAFVDHKKSFLRQEALSAQGADTAQSLNELRLAGTRRLSCLWMGGDARRDRAAKALRRQKS